MLDEAVG
jgi:hypothetical protein